MVDVEGTREAFKGLLDKPPLTDALLNRPPFKFILDVVTNTISKTGYLKSQFPKDDLDPAKMADKSAKCAFLDKLISILDDGSLGDVKSAKIVAGKEPESTCLMLRKLADNARSHLGTAAKPEKKSSKTKEEKPSKEKTKEKEKETPKLKKKSDDKDKENKEKRSSRSTSKEPKEEKKSKSKSASRDSSVKERKSKLPSSDDKKKKEKKDKPEKKHKKDVDEERMVSPPDTLLGHHLDVEADDGFSEQLHNSHREDSPNIENLSPAKTDDSGIDAESPRPLPPEERSINRLATAIARPQTSMGRPGTAAARPAPPKMKKKQIAIIETAAPAVEVTADIMDDNDHETKEEDFVVEEATPEEPVAFNEPEPIELSGEQGALVKKMMETKAGLEEGQVVEDIDEDDGDMVKERAQVDALQKTLQTVTRTTYPLARLFDYAQEDLESMIRELEKWRSETRTNEAELKDREANGMSDSHKLTTALSTLEDEIRDMKTTLSGAKGRVVANDEKIFMLMSGL